MKLLIAIDAEGEIGRAMLCHQTGDSAQPFTVALDHARQLDLDVAQSIGLERYCQRLRQAIVEALSSGNVCIGEWIGHADSLPGDDPRQRLMRYEIGGSEAR